MQILKSRCVRFSLVLDEIHHITESYLNGQITVCLAVYNDHCMNAITFEFFDNACPYNLKEIVVIGVVILQNLNRLFVRQTRDRKPCLALVPVYRKIYPK